MIRNITIICFLCISTFLIAQNHKTYDDFYKNRWEVPYNWVENDTIKLQLAQKNDNKKFDYGEFISFDKNKKVTYKRFMYCPVGETFRNIQNFLIFEDKAYIYYKTKSWNADDTKWKKKHKKYRILTYDDTTMTLVRI